MIRPYSLLLACMLSLSACANNPPVPEDRYYRLPWPHTSLAEVKLTAGGIFVEQFIADGLYRERPLIHADDRMGMELKQYHYHHWVDSPARMLRDHLIRYLTESRAADYVVDYIDPSANLAIHGKIKAFERSIYNNTDQVNVEIDFRVDKTGNGLTVLTSTYHVRTPVRTHHMNEVVLAFENALKQVYAQLLADLSDKLIHQDSSR